MIYIDASRYQITKEKTGVEKYTVEMIHELRKLAPKKITLITPKPIDCDLPQIVIPFPRLWTLIRLSWEVFRNKRIDNLFIPSHVLPLILPKFSAITIHDVAFRHQPASYSWASRWYLNWAAKRAVKKADIIFTPSETTKNDLIHFFGAKADKVIVAYLGIEKMPTELKKEREILKKNGIETKKYFFYIGRIETKKNSDTLIKAFTDFCRKNPYGKLVLAGKTGHGGKAIIESIPENFRERIVTTGFIDENEKWVLMKNAGAFVFPSRYEGFGLPLLEAMSAKIPIIASAIPSTKEIAEESAHYFSPDKANKLTSLMDEQFNEPAKSNAKIKEYDGILKKYSWSNCAETIFKSIEQNTESKK